VIPAGRTVGKGIEVGRAVSAGASNRSGGYGGNVVFSLAVAIAMLNSTFVPGQVLQLLLETVHYGVLINSSIKGMLKQKQPTRKSKKLF